MSRPRRQQVGVYFKCCRVYVWAILNHQKTAYNAYCPKCTGKMTIALSSSGSKSRFFEAS